MRIGFDVDGVLADFNTDFIKRVIAITGKDLFGPGFVPRTWNYPTDVGYTPEETDQVWKSITADPTFWLNLKPYWDGMTILERLRPQAYDHDLYFITSRPGVKAKQQTEVWLATHSGDFLWQPTVMIASDKGACAKALKLDVYIDDRWENVVDVVNATRLDPLKPADAERNPPKTATYLLSQPWNERYHLADVFCVRRIETAGEFLDTLALDERKAA